MFRSTKVEGNTMRDMRSWSTLFVKLFQEFNISSIWATHHTYCSLSPLLHDLFWFFLLCFARRLWVWEGGGHVVQHQLLVRPAVSGTLGWGEGRGRVRRVWQRVWPGLGTWISQSHLWCYSDTIDMFDLASPRELGWSSHECWGRSGDGHRSGRDHGYGGPGRGDLRHCSLLISQTQRLRITWGSSVAGGGGEDVVMVVGVKVASHSGSGVWRLFHW